MAKVLDVNELTLSVFHAFLRPVLMKSRDAILSMLEIKQLVADAFFDEDTTGVMVDYGLLVL